MVNGQEGGTVEWEMTEAKRSFSRMHMYMHLLVCKKGRWEGGGKTSGFLALVWERERIPLCFPLLLFTVKPLFPLARLMLIIHLSKGCTASCADFHFLLLSSVGTPAHRGGLKPRWSESMRGKSTIQGRELGGKCLQLGKWFQRLILAA